MLSKDLEINVDPPLTVNHETSKIYAALRQCMRNNQELRSALLEAAATIEQLTDALSTNTGESK